MLNSFKRTFILNVQPIPDMLLSGSSCQVVGLCSPFQSLSGCCSVSDGCHKVLKMIQPCIKKTKQKTTTTNKLWVFAARECDTPAQKLWLCHLATTVALKSALGTNCASTTECCSCGLGTWSARRAGRTSSELAGCCRWSAPPRHLSGRLSSASSWNSSVLHRQARVGDTSSII